MLKGTLQEQWRITQQRFLSFSHKEPGNAKAMRGMTKTLRISLGCNQMTIQNWGSLCLGWFQISVPYHPRPPKKGFLHFPQPHIVPRQYYPVSPPPDSQQFAPLFFNIGLTLIFLDPVCNQVLSDLDQMVYELCLLGIHTQTRFSSY